VFIHKQAFHAFICALLLWAGCACASGQVRLASDQWVIAIDPVTLSIDAETAAGQSIVLSMPQAGLGEVTDPLKQEHATSWSYPVSGLMVSVELHSDQLTLRFASNQPGEVTFPVLPNSDQFKAFILPNYEGVYARTDDPEWMGRLVDHGPMDTTADLSMPFIGIDLGGQALAYLFDQVFDNELLFTRGTTGQVSGSVTHTFRPNWEAWAYTVIIRLGDGSPITPAIKYREYLIERGGFVSMEQKIEANPKVERLLGAAHAYLWDAGVFSHLDATDWKGFAAKLIAEGKIPTKGPSEKPDTLGKQIWDSFTDEQREAAVLITTEEWPYKHIKSQVAMGISEFLAVQHEAESEDQSHTDILEAFCDHFAGLVGDYNEWGDGISTKLIDQLHGAGIDRMLLCMSDMTCAHFKPQVARYADELGYLFGPYDSYHSIHKPDAHPDTTWETAQFGWDAYHAGGVVKADGSMSAGFKKVGYHFSPIAARPYVEARVNGYMARVPHSTVFVDCDAYGQFFDDYSPDRPATKQQDMLERLSRLDWLNQEHGLVVGSEGGSAYAAPVIHYAHGMLTPVIGWGDPDFKDRQSPYYKGAYYPPDGPATFVKQVPLKPVYLKPYYDPASRLPLYQVVFHDSVIATHHWGNASLKFKDQIKTVALLEQLYNVPPLYHLNAAEFKKHKQHIVDHDAFFSPLHRELALQPMTGFEWLTEDRLVQQTTFSDGTRIIANFGEHEAVVGDLELAPQSATAVLPDGEVRVYLP